MSVAANRLRGQLCCVWLGCAFGGIPSVARAQSDAAGSIGPASLSNTLRSEQASTVQSVPALALPDGTPDTRSLGQDPALGKTVRDRPRSDYTANPIPVGALQLSTIATIDGGYDGNVFRTRKGLSDAFGIARLDATLASAAPRNPYYLKARLNELAYRRYGTENAFTYSVDAGGRLDLAGSDTLSLNVGQAHETLERSTATEIITTYRPIRFDLTTANLAAHKGLGRIALNVGLLFANFNYHNAETPSRQPLDENYRDNHTYTGRADLSYALGPGPVIYVAAQGNLVRYPNPNVLGRNLGSDQIQLTAGVRGQITPLLRGELGAGYIHANLKAGPNQGGPTVEASLQYLFTELTTFTLSANRSFQNVGSITTPLTLATQVKLQADHELLRNLILSVSVAHRDDNYTTGEGGSHEWIVRGQTNWLINHHLSAIFNIGDRQRHGFGRLVDRNFSELTATGGIAFRP